MVENPVIASLWIYSCSQTEAHSVKLEAQNDSQGTTVAALCSHLIKLGSMQLRCTKWWMFTVNLLKPLYFFKGAVQLNYIFMCFLALKAVYRNM